MNEASFGGAMMTQLGKKLNPFNRSGESQLSIQDRMVQQQFVKDLVGKAATSVSQGIKSGLIDPSTKAGLVAAPAKQEPIKIGGQVLNPKNPDEKALIDKINAQQGGPAAAPAATVSTPVAAPAASTSAPATPETPAQVRARKQKAAAQAAQKQMTPKAVAPAAPAAKTPAQIRAEKQAAATQAAQKQMTPKPVAPAAPAAKTPAQVRAEKQAAATQAAQKQMTPKAAVWKNPRKPNQPAKTSPRFESSFNKLNAIFENIVNLDEQGKQYQFTISSYLEQFLKNYMGGMDISGLKPQIDQVQSSFKFGGGRKALEKLATAAYSLYSAGGPASAEKAADQAGATTKSASPSLAAMIGGNPSTATATEPVASAGATGAAAAEPTVGTTTATPSAPSAQEPAASQPTAATTAPSNAMEPPPASPEKVKTVYMQVKDLVNKLDKKGKQRILATLEKEIGTTPAPKSVATDTSTGGAGAFGQMAGQLAKAPAKSSTGGTTTTTPGVVKHTAGKGTKIKQAKANQAKKPSTSNVIPLKRTKKAVAESKTYKVWGQE